MAPQSVGGEPVAIQLRRSLRRIAIATVVLYVVIIAIAGKIYVDGKTNTDNTRDNRELICAMSRLVSFVPAVQFEGEPMSNFIGWLESRRDMLLVVQNRNLCSEETEDLLRNRVVLDTQLLIKIQRERKKQ